jgi:tripartite-type tricarboxylate transporter receptor subunit TctC
MIRTLLVATLCAWTLHGMGLAHAQAQGEPYPNRPIRMVVPFPAGGPTDGMARIISDRLGEVLGQTIVVENRGGGAGGSVGAKVVATADPDGYTILITPGGALTTGPAVHSNIGYDPVKAFVPVAYLIESPLVIASHQDLPVRSLADVVAYAKANPDKIIWGSQGFGTAPHLLVEMFKLETGMNAEKTRMKSAFVASSLRWVSYWCPKPREISKPRSAGFPWGCRPPSVRSRGSALAGKDRGWRHSPWTARRRGFPARARASSSCCEKRTKAPRSAC